MPYCTNCGNKMRDEDKFCSKCGHPANNSVKEEEKETEFPEPLDFD